MSTPPNDHLEANGNTNLPSSRSPFPGGSIGISLVTPAAVTQSQGSINDEGVNNTPQASLSALRDFASPELPSPVRLSSPALRRVLDRVDEPGLKRRGLNLVTEKKAKRRATEQMVDISKSLLTFLRDPIVTAACDAYKPPVILILVQKCLSHFDPKREKPATGRGTTTTEQPNKRSIPNDRRRRLFKKKIDWSVDLPKPLLLHHSRLIIEEIIQLEVGAKVVILVSDVDPFFKATWFDLLWKEYASTVPSTRINSAPTSTCQA